MEPGRRSRKGLGCVAVSWLRRRLGPGRSSCRPDRVSVDQGTTYHIPYVWCLTNTCIAGELADPTLIKRMETGEKLALEVVDSNVLTVSTALPLAKLATIRSSAPAQVFEQGIDE